MRTRLLLMLNTILSGVLYAATTRDNPYLPCSDGCSTKVMSLLQASTQLIDHGARAARGRLAVFITGIEDIMVWQSKAGSIVAAPVREGFAVDVYLVLVRSGKQTGKPYISTDGAGSAGRFNMTNAEIDVAQAGGRLVYRKILRHHENVEASFPSNTDFFEKRISRYSPLHTAAGANLLRRYFTYESMLQQAARIEALEQFQYDLVLVTRDDDYWVEPLRLTGFMQGLNWRRTVFSKDCNLWGGINDKTLLFGREAAKRILGRIFTDFWLPTQRLNVKTAEHFVSVFAKMKRVVSRVVAFQLLPTFVSVYVGNSTMSKLCISPIDSCHVPVGVNFEVCNISTSAPHQQLRASKFKFWKPSESHGHHGLNTAVFKLLILSALTCVFQWMWGIETTS